MKKRKNKKKKKAKRYKCIFHEIREKGRRKGDTNVSFLKNKKKGGKDYIRKNNKE